MAIALSDPIEKLDKHLDEVWERLQHERLARVARRSVRPLIRLWDGDWNFRGVVAGEIDFSFEWRMNDVGGGFVKLPHDHYLALWAMGVYKRPTRNIHITVDKDGARWGGRMQSATLVKNEDGTRHVELKFLDDVKELDHIHVWPNAFLPAGVQFPKAFILAGPSRYTLKLALFINLMRLSGNFWHLPDDPLDPRTWVEGIVPHLWPILVQPDSLVMDDSQWCIISSRFDSWMEMARPILQDAGLMIVTRRWIEGDPKPKGYLFPLRTGQLIIDIVDKSGVYEQTATGGTIFGGMWRTVTRLGDNLVDEVITDVVNPVEPAEYSLSQFLGTKPAQPWVVFRDGDVSPVKSGSWTWEPATVVQINAGGRSAPGVNTFISANIQLVGNLIGAVFLMNGIGAIADTALKPLYEDIFLAFGSIKSPFRSAKAGWSHYHEGWADGAETSYSLSGLVAFRQAFWETRSRSKVTVDLEGGPWTIGTEGQGHCWLGDRVGVTLEGMPRGQYEVHQISGLVLAGSRGEPVKWSMTVGDPRTDQAPIERLLNQSRFFFEAIKKLGVWS